MITLVFDTALGHTALGLDGSGIHGLSFGYSTERLALKALSKKLGQDATADLATSEGDELGGRIRAFASGDADDFADLQISECHLTDFGRRVTAACRQIAWGETLTYGELAKQAGRPGAARAVGSVMARNRVPLIVPCHRVVPASGGLGGFSAPQGVVMKRRLLEMERLAAMAVMA